MFRFLIAKRWWVLLVYALLLPPSIYLALHVEQDDALERLIVQSDPDFKTAQEFGKVFPEGSFVLLLAEASDPFAPEVLRKVDALERRLDALGKVEANSALSVFRRAHPGFEATSARAEEFRSFVNGTDLFRRQGLAGERFLAIGLGLDVRNPAERNSVLAAIDRVTEEVDRAPAPLSALRKVGEPYVGRMLESETSNAAKRYIPLFGILLVTLNLFLYRSFRALAAFGITTLVSVALTVGYVGATGGVLTIVSSLVPMTILITCTATLVYIHSRFVEQPDDTSFEQHQIFALSNKFLPCTASVFATFAGFAALSVSRIRPIREMGLWTAAGLAITWVVCFTLFPALQRILNTPTQTERKVAAQWFQRFTDRLPLFTYRWRYVLVSGALLLSAVGAVSVFGLPGILAPMPLETDSLEYIDHDTRLYRDTRALERIIAGLSVTEVWLRGEPGSVTDPEVLAGLDRFSRSLESDPRIGSVMGPSTLLRMFRYLGGKGDRLPEDPQELEKLAGDLESLLPREPSLRQFLEPATLSQARLTVITREGAFPEYGDLARFLDQRWKETVAAEPALGSFELRATGRGPLQAKIAHNLVPTLTESFALTAVFIFVTFLFVFRNAAARLMAMIPSLFAILVMFAFMRLTGIALNVATILMATTVLGASENDQIHFFYHFLEKRRQGSTEAGLRHTLFVAGRAIVFATLINAGGFLAFGMSDLPPMRHFGMLAALAFLLSMLADFTALPAALWIVFGEKPDALKARDAQPGHARRAAR